MSGQADKFKIGLFVVAGLLLGVTLMVWLGAKPYFSPKKTVVAYFSESVQGLDPDSAVKFRGVPVGRIRAIRMAPDHRLIEVVMGLDPGFQISDDLGVKIGFLNISGMRYLEMDRFDPEQPREPMTLDFEPPYPVIKTYPSDIGAIGDRLDKILRKAEAVDVQKLSVRLLSISAKLDKILDDPKVLSVGSEAAGAFTEIKKSAKRFNDEIDRMQAARKVSRTLDKASEALDEITQTARSADRMVKRTDNNLGALTQKLDRSADNLQDFTTRLRTQPLSTLWGTSDEKKKEKKR
jgi:phospholipid/cholesterol/gamma-HCH transport system substrate-binding protein